MLAHVPVIVALALLLAVFSGPTGAVTLPVADNCDFVCPETIEKFGQTYYLTLQRDGGGYVQCNSLRNNRRGRFFYRFGPFLILLSRPPAPGSNLDRFPRKLDHSNRIE
ncbi:hypothetical protein DFH06DRAFT_1141209 [Mycena polygramma]|nr:hypothetical protein DFH06DRAFT_1141209 [Mycena polygramma]